MFTNLNLRQINSYSNTVYFCLSATYGIRENGICFRRIWTKTTWLFLFNILRQIFNLNVIKNCFCFSLMLGKNLSHMLFCFINPNNNFTK